MFCGSCGKEIDNHARFCPYCGAQTAAPQQAPVQPVRQTSPVQTAAPVQQNEAQPTAPASKTFGEVQQTTDVSAKKKGKFKFLGGRRKEKPAENSAKEKKRPKLPEPTPGRRAIPGSNSFVPPAAGLIIASKVIRDLIQ